MDNFATSTESIILSLYALGSFLFVMRKLIFNNLLSEPFFWINSGVLFYFSGNLLVYVFSNYLVSSGLYNDSHIWSITPILSIFFNILLSIGFWKTRAI